MKRSALLLLISITFAIGSHAQIPNSSFENWVFDGSCMQPLGWAGINDWMGLTENCYSISRSDDHYPPAAGNYSIKIENRISVLPDLGAAGLAWTGDSTGFGADQPAFPVSGHPTYLCGYYKFFPQNGDTMDIHFQFYKNGVEVVGGGFTANSTIAEWTPFKIPVSDFNYPGVDSARIMLSSFYSDSFALHGNSVLYIDNLSFDTLVPSAVEQIAGPETFLSAFPNPANSFVTLKINRTILNEMNLEIYNQIGILVKSEKLKQNQLTVKTTDLNEGIYIMILRTGDFTTKQKLVIQH